MMLDSKIMQAKMVETVYSLSSSGRLSWTEKSRDSYSAKIDEVTIDVDKTSLGEQVTYVLWVFSPKGLAGRIDGRDLKSNPEIGNEVSYYEILKKTFDYAQKHVKDTNLERALNIVEAFREKNSENPEDLLG